MESRGAVPGPLKPGPQIYQSIGVEPIINCVGAFTIIGASIEPPEVRAAMDSAANYNVQIDELAFGVGQRLAELTGAEWGMVSSGCAGAMNEFTAGVLAGGNPEKLIRIPNLEGFEKTEVIIPRGSRSAYDHAIRNCGVKVIMVNTLEEFKNALGPKTAMVYMSPGGRNNAGDPNALSIENMSKLTKAMNPIVPLLVDAAAEGLSLKPNMHLAAGATAVSYSGGKCIRGPQCSGLLLGDKKFIMSAWQASAPHHGPCRDNKVGREEHLGVLAAVELWASTDHPAEIKMWVGWCEDIAKRVSVIETVKTTITEPASLTSDNPTPRLVITWDPDKLKITGQEVVDELSTTKPRIALGGPGGAINRGVAPVAPGASSTTSISIAAHMMGPGEYKIVADRIYEVLNRKRSAAKAEAPMKAPAADLSGRWQVDIEFYTSKSTHTFIIEKQDGNWLQGTHQGEFNAPRALLGTIDGDQVKFQSRFSAPGDSVTMTFHGTVSGDTMTGEIDMIEYINAKFTAKRYSYPNQRNRINVPVGRPLAT